MAQARTLAEVWMSADPDPSIALEWIEPERVHTERREHRAFRRSGLILIEIQGSALTPEGAYRQLDDLEWWHEWKTLPVPPLPPLPAKNASNGPVFAFMGQRNSNPWLGEKDWPEIQQGRLAWYKKLATAQDIPEWARAPTTAAAGPYNEPRGWCPGLSPAAPEAQASKPKPERKRRR